MEGESRDSDSGDSSVSHRPLQSQRSTIHHPRPQHRSDQGLFDKSRWRRGCGWAAGGRPLASSEQGTFSMSESGVDSLFGSGIGVPCGLQGLMRTDHADRSCNADRSCVTRTDSVASGSRVFTEAGHILRSPDGLVSLTGPLDRPFIQAATDLESLYRTGAAPSPPAKRRCNADMPRARRPQPRPTTNN